ncbi:MAG: cysteine--tRNA ligase [Chitinivibrionales bacterium]|nr:cysteine--tRNA ligase [Chitinivibrionales bacterium]
MSQPLYLYNTATRSKEVFTTDQNTVGMYCCGPTVYNYAHIGNLRTYLFEDILKRALLWLGYKVKHIVNITDVGHLVSDEDTGEDKMERGAQREGKTVWEIAQMYADAFMNNIHDLHILDPDLWPKATDHLDEMIELVQQLESRGFTYSTSDGIYFDTAHFPAYVDFARLDPQSLQAGSRVEMGEKKAPTDFALWKFSPRDVKRQMEWDSPWGMGFPGWHIECSAMSLKYLGQPLDIHCGGTDHIRIHHTNEIAQVEAATGKQFARFWMHGEFLVLDKEKMAKSGGNFITLDTVKQRGIDPLAYRMFTFTAHYRTPLTFSWDALHAAAQSLQNLKKLIPGESAEAADADLVSEGIARFGEAICDDLNLPRALGVLWETLKNPNLTNATKRAVASEADCILALDLLTRDAREIVTEFTSATGEVIKFISSAQTDHATLEDIKLKIERRKHARARKQFDIADAIREEFARKGYVIKDMKNGTTECVLP